MSERSIARPSVTIHYAQTLDGRIATRSGQSQWISGQASLRLAHELRASHSAVMVGVGTILCDNPRLTVRLAQGRSPLRLVADSTLRLPRDANVLIDRSVETLIVTTARASPARIAIIKDSGARVMVVKQDTAGLVDLGDLLGRLGSMGIDSLLVEGGRSLVTSLLRERFVDRLVLCTAPKVLGTGIEAVGDLGIGRLSEALRFVETHVSQLGEDMIFDGRLERSIEAAG